MIIWTESQLILACIGMLGVMSVVPVYMYAGSKRNPIVRPDGRTINRRVK